MISKGRSFPFLLGGVAFLLRLISITGVFFLVPLSIAENQDRKSFWKAFSCFQFLYWVCALGFASIIGWEKESVRIFFMINIIKDFWALAVWRIVLIVLKKWDNNFDSSLVAGFAAVLLTTILVRLPVSLNLLDEYLEVLVNWSNAWSPYFGVLGINESWPAGYQDFTDLREWVLVFQGAKLFISIGLPLMISTRRMGFKTIYDRKTGVVVTLFVISLAGIILFSTNTLDGRSYRTIVYLFLDLFQIVIISVFFMGIHWMNRLWKTIEKSIKRPLPLVGLGLLVLASMTFLILPREVILLVGVSGLIGTLMNFPRKEGEENENHT